ncbi:murein hydrolase activator EnvC family protein [Xanthobacter sp. TB0136]|uniref:murein hydrolase activator EnvC family protein n=1 Tax=Xanthobacter sp. TB0136 TaxID=3459177 RepID=UPI00403A2820
MAGQALVHAQSPAPAAGAQRSPAAPVSSPPVPPVPGSSASTPPASSPSRAIVPLPPRPPARALVEGVDTEALKADLAREAELRTRLLAEVEEAKGDRAKLNKLLIESTTRARTIEQQLSVVEARLQPLDGAATELTASLAQRREVLGEVLAALLRMGRNPPPAMLMRPDDALDSVRSAILMGALLPEMRVEAETLAADLSELVRVRTELAKARETLTSLRAALVEDQARIATLVKERQRLQVAQNPVSPDDRTRAAAVARNAGEVDTLVNRLEAEVAPAARAAGAAQAAEATRPPDEASRAAGLAALNDPGRIAPAMAFANARGLLPLPVAGKRLKNFGADDGVGGQEKGITIATRPGAQVSAPADGWVVYSGPFRSYGQLLIINAGGGYHILLAGMERIEVELGQFVLAGEPVGVMGGAARSGTSPSGAASGQPHLYVEFRKDGNSIDPAPWWAVTDSRKVRG